MDSGTPWPFLLRCLFREASQKHKSERQDKFRRSAVGSPASPRHPYPLPHRDGG